MTKVRHNFSNAAKCYELYFSANLFHLCEARTSFGWKRMSSKLVENEQHFSLNVIFSRQAELCVCTDLASSFTCIIPFRHTHARTQLSLVPQWYRVECKKWDGAHKKNATIKDYRFNLNCTKHILNFWINRV